jgi:uncharacterized phage-associated protein
MKVNRRKLKNLILYISAVCGDDVHWGAIKLNKVLHKADFGFFEAHRESITNSNYIALEQGPAPNAMVPIIRELVETGRLAIQKRGRQKRPVALADPDLSLFTAEQISVVDKAIEELRHLTAKEASDNTHDAIGWIAARAKAKATKKSVVIPYESVFISAPPADPFEKAHGRELVAQHGW